MKKVKVKNGHDTFLLAFSISALQLLVKNFTHDLAFSFMLAEKLNRNIRYYSLTSVTSYSCKTYTKTNNRFIIVYFILSF